MELVKGVLHVVKPGIGIVSMGFGFWVSFSAGNLLCVELAVSHHSAAEELGGSETMEMSLVLRLVLKSAHGVRFLRFFLDLQITSPPETRWLLRLHRGPTPLSQGECGSLCPLHFPCASYLFWLQLLALSAVSGIVFQ